jgi:hypothetical protein
MKEVEAQNRGQGCRAERQRGRVGVKHGNAGRRLAIA